MKRLFLAMMLPGLLLAGCGDGEDGGAPQARAADVQRFCELIEQYNKGDGFVPPPQDTPADQQDAALAKSMKDYLSLPEIQAILDELGEVAPPEVDESVGVMRERADELVETGENTFTAPEAIAANDEIKAYTETACAPPSESASPEDAAPEDEAEQG